MCYVDRVLRHGCGRGAGCLGCVLRRVTAFLLAGVGEGRGERGESGERVVRECGECGEVWSVMWGGRAHALGHVRNLLPFLFISIICQKMCETTRDNHTF